MKFKKLIYLIIIITIAFLTILAASCGNGEDESNPYISDDSYLQLPLSEYTTNLGNGGLWIDLINGELAVAEADLSFPKEIPKNDDIIIIGWAFDGNAMKPLSAMYVKIGDVSIKCNYGGSRGDVADHFNNPDLTETGFRVRIPASVTQHSDKIEFVMITADGEYRYPHVEVNLVD